MWCQGKSSIDFLHVTESNLWSPPMRWISSFNMDPVPIVRAFKCSMNIECRRQYTVEMCSNKANLQNYIIAVQCLKAICINWGMVFTISLEFIQKDENSKSQVSPIYSKKHWPGIATKCNREQKFGILYFPNIYNSFYFRYEYNTKHIKIYHYTFTGVMHVCLY